MAKRFANADCDLTSLVNFETAFNTPAIHATTNITLGVTVKYSDVLTAPNLVNGATGLSFIVTSAGTAGTITANLQEFNGLIWLTVASQTMNVTSLTANEVNSIRLAAPYVFLTTTAGYYRWELSIAGGVGTTSIVASSGGTTFACWAWCDIVGAINTTADDLVMSGWNGTNTVNVASIASGSFGSFASTEVATYRSVHNALTIGRGGRFYAPRGSSSDVAIRGNWCVAGGNLDFGTDASPIPAGVVAQFINYQNGATCNHGGRVSASANSVATFVGATKTEYKTTYASGVGTAADPIVFADSVSWSAGDKVFIDPTDLYNHGEYRYIIAVISPTTYVWSATLGGAEAALTYTHTTSARVFNLTNTVKVTTDNAAFGTYCNNDSPTAGNFHTAWFTISTVGSTTASKLGWTYSASIYGTRWSAHHCVAENVLYYGFYWSSNNTTTDTATDMVAGFNTTTANNPANAIYIGTQRGGTFSRLYARDFSKWGITAASCISLIGEDWSAVGCNHTNTSQSGILFASLANCTISGINEAHCNRGFGVTYSGLTATKIYNLKLGTKGNNAVADVAVVADSFNDCVMYNCEQTNTTFVYNQSDQAAGSKIRFHRYQNTDNRHIWFGKYGTGRSTGALLPDTTVYTPGSLGARFDPINSSIGFTWEFKILARAGRQVYVTGVVQKNAAMAADDVQVDLYLPESTTADDSDLLPNDANWNQFVVGALYTGTIDALARVIVTSRSTAAGAYAYIDDIYGGTDQLNGLDVWDDGMPGSLIVEQVGDAAAVWQTLLSSIVSTGTTGWLLKKLLTVAKFLSLK